MTVITSSRISLRKWQFNHDRLKTMVGWLNDPEVVRYSEQRHKEHTEESQQFYLQDGPDVFREIHAGDRFIGTISAYIDEPNSIADVGILIGDKSIWGKGYGTEAWIAFCDHLFLHKIRKIEAGAMNINSRMINIFRKSGMHFEAFRENHFLYDGEPVHMVLWGKFNGERHG